MNKVLTIAVFLASVLVIGGCSDSSINRVDRPDPSVDFTTFVQGELANTSDTRAAVQINDTEFSFNDQNNPQAFDDQLR